MAIVIPTDEDGPSVSPGAPSAPPRINPALAALTGGAGLARAATAGFEAIADIDDAAAETRRRKLEKQQRDADNAYIADGLNQVNEGLARDLHRLRAESDPSEPDWLGAFERTMEDRISDVLEREGVTASAQQDLRGRLGRVRGHYIDTALEMRGRALTEKAELAIARNVNTLAAGVRRNPASLDRSLGAMTSLMGQFEDTLTPQAIEAGRAEATAQLLRATVRGHLDVGGWAQAEAALDDRRFDAVVTPELRDSLIGEIAAERRLAADEVVDEAKGAIAVNETGRSVPGQEAIKAELREVADAGSERARRALAALQQAEDARDEIRAFAVKPIGAQRDEVEARARSQTMTPDELGRVQRLARVHEAITTGLAQDPFRTAARYGVLTEPAEVDFADPESLRARHRQALEIERAWGVEVPALSQGEARQFEAALDEAGPGGGAALLRNAVAGLGPDGTERIAGLFRTSRPELAIAFMRAPGDLQLAEDVLDGAATLRANPDLGLSSGEAEAALAETYGNLFEYTPELRAPLRAAAEALYVKSLGGEPPKAGVDADRLETAMMRAAGGRMGAGGEVAGGPIERNGRVLLPPKPGMDEGDLVALLSTLKDGDLPLFGNGAPVDLRGRAIPAEAIRDDAQLVSVGEGRYMVLFKDLGFAGIENPAPGEGAYVLDLRRLIDETGQTYGSDTGFALGGSGR